MHTTDTHLVVSQRAVLRALVAFALVGVVLGVVGLRAAFHTLGGPHTAEGRILVVAIATALVTLTAALGLSRHLARAAGTSARK